MVERGPRRATIENGGLREIRVITAAKAAEIRDGVLRLAQTANDGERVPGAVAVYDATGMRLSFQTTDGATPLFVDMAEIKAKTVLKVRRSISLQNTRMAGRGQALTDFGGAIPTSVPGGVAIFADEAHTQFAGAVGFSGGDALKVDQAICRQAVEEAGLYTDLPKPEEKK